MGFIGTEGTGVVFFGFEAARMQELTVGLLGFEAGIQKQLGCGLSGFISLEGWSC